MLELPYSLAECSNGKHCSVSGVHSCDEDRILLLWLFGLFCEDDDDDYSAGLVSTLVGALRRVWSIWIITPDYGVLIGIGVGLPPLPLSLSCILGSWPMYICPKCPT